MTSLSMRFIKTFQSVETEEKFCTGKIHSWTLKRHMSSLFTNNFWNDTDIADEREGERTF